MPFPSYVGTHADDLANAWGWIRSHAGSVKVGAQQLRDSSAAGPTTAGAVVQFCNSLANSRIMLNRATAVPGIQTYVRSQINDPALDLVATYSAMTTQMDACRTWIVNNFPKDGNGFLLYQTLDANGLLQERTLTSVQTAGLRTQLDALIATID